MNIEIGIPDITYEEIFDGSEFRIVPCSHGDRMQTIRLSDEQIIAIVDKYFELKADMGDKKNDRE